MNYTKKILDTLLDSFEKSKTFTGENLVRQTFSIKPEKLFPDYADSAAFDVFKTVNQQFPSFREK